jgi:pimeloyl-ACP methyl ester carboxylesterase
MATFVLVHGSTHSARAWQWVSAELDRYGQIVVTPELPADDPDASSAVYAGAILSSMPEGEPPIVVAHSATGWFLPMVAARRHVRRMIFLAAAVPRIGMSFVQVLQAEPEMLNPAWLGKDPQIKAVANEFLFHDCAPERLPFAHSTIRVIHARGAMVDPYPLTKWPDVPSAYIVCAEDRTIRPDWSRRVARSQLGVEPIELPGGHCPYISRPEELARVLLKLSD